MKEAKLFFVLFILYTFILTKLCFPQSLHNQEPFVKCFTCETKEYSNIGIKSNYYVYEKFDTNKIKINNKYYNNYLLAFDSTTVNDFLRVDNEKIIIIYNNYTSEQILIDMCYGENSEWRLIPKISTGKFLNNLTLKVDSVSYLTQDTIFYVSCKPILRISELIELRSFVYSKKRGF